MTARHYRPRRGVPRQAAFAHARHYHPPMDICVLRRPGALHARRRRDPHGEPRRRVRRRRPPRRARAAPDRLGPRTALRRRARVAHGAARRGSRRSAINFPSYFVAAPAQGGVARPPAPRRLRRRRRAVERLRRSTTTSLELQRLLTEWDTRALVGGRAPLHDLRRRRRPPGPLQRARGRAAVPPAAARRPAASRALRRLRVLPDAPRGQQASGPARRRARRTCEAPVRVAIAGRGIARRRARRERGPPGRRATGSTCSGS